MSDAGARARDECDAAHAVRAAKGWFGSLTWSSSITFPSGSRP
jgi:hypothetical protein